MVEHIFAVGVHNNLNEEKDEVVAAYAQNRCNNKRR